MARIGEPNPLGKSVGLLVGICGFTGVLLAPWLAAPWARALFWLVPLMALGSLALLIFRRQHRASVLVAVLLLCVVAAVLLAPALSAMPRLARSTLASAVLMASWWITVAIPIPATSLLPLVLFPIFGILTSKETAVNYASEIIFLFMGGFILALGIQRWGLHRRIALHIVQVFGTNPSRMVLGFMVATAFLSMWISNTATSLMMLPIALAVVASLREVEDRSHQSVSRRRCCSASPTPPRSAAWPLPSGHLPTSRFSESWRFSSPTHPLSRSAVGFSPFFPSYWSFFPLPGCS